ncbi:hypothetical protein WN944_012649 [Citrus x changshan-huyou]|uniref:Yippee domain-containing protein n=1 Tax=Citrus x changshan-huyou TaxID=2935761 RepID=A0AAP0MXX7_9ROSI
MGRLFIESLSGPRIFKCKSCKVDSASPDHIVSKAFQGRFGRAYLFRSVVNVSLGPREERLLVSGLHSVNDIYCSSCQQLLGWRYEKAYEESQKYKEGMYILEKERMLKAGCMAVQLPDPYISRRILLKMYGWSTAQLPQTQVYYDKLVLECQWRITVRFEARKDNNGYLTLKERVPQIIKNMLGPILDRLTTIFLHSEDEIHFLPQKL